MAQHGVLEIRSQRRAPKHWTFKFKDSFSFLCLFNQPIYFSGRGKKKKIMRLLMPILMAIKLKIAIVTLISFFGIALIAKKALVAGAIALAITSYIGIKKLMTQQQQHKNTYKATYDDTWSGSWHNSPNGASFGHSGHGDVHYGNHGGSVAYAAHKNS